MRYPLDKPLPWHLHPGPEYPSGYFGDDEFPECPCGDSVESCDESCGNPALVEFEPPFPDPMEDAP